MKAGINLWTMPAEWSLDESLRAAASSGFRGVELVFDLDGSSLRVRGAETEDLEAVRRQVSDLGLNVTSVACLELMQFPLSSPDASRRRQGMDLVRRLLDHAATLQAAGVLVVPGYVQLAWEPHGEVIPYDEAYRWAQDSVAALAPKAESLRVWIGIENVWNKFLLSPLEMRSFLDAIGSDWVKAYFDVGNVLLHGFPDQWIRILGRRIGQVHVKDYRVAVGSLDGFVNLLEGDVDWPAVRQALLDIGYDGYLVAEIMPPYRFGPQVLVETTARSLHAIVSGEIPTARRWSTGELLAGGGTHGDTRGRK